MSDTQLQAITAYLEARLPGHKLASESAPATGETVIQARKDGREYTLHIDSSFLESAVETGQIQRILEEWNLAAELCRAEGMPLMLTEGGIRLASSN